MDTFNANDYIRFLVFSAFRIDAGIMTRQRRGARLAGAPRRVGLAKRRLRLPAAGRPAAPRSCHWINPAGFSLPWKTPTTRWPATTCARMPIWTRIRQNHLAAARLSHGRLRSSSVRNPPQIYRRRAQGCSRGPRHARRPANCEKHARMQRMLDQQRCLTRHAMNAHVTLGFPGAPVHAGPQHSGTLSG